MPDYPKPNSQWLASHLAQLRQQGTALAVQSTQYITDPTILNPSPTTPNCKAIIGDVSHDNFGNSTGLSGWGMASKSTGSWVKL